MIDEPHEPEFDDANSPSPQADAPVEAAEEMTEQQLAEAKQYGRADLACTVADMVIDLVFLSIAALLLAVPLDRFLQETFTWLENRWIRLAAMFLLVTAMHAVVSFPLSFYSGHLLEHQYKMSRLTVAGWFWRYAKRMTLTFTIGLALFEGLYVVIWLTGSYWWLAGAGAAFLVGIVAGQLIPVLILPLFYKIERLDDDGLTDRLARLSEGTGLSIEGVYRMHLSAETVKANAMLAGLGRTRRVLLGDTLLDGFSEEEIEVVFAHEIGHHVHRHIWKLLMMGLAMTVGGFFLADLALRAWVHEIDGFVDYATLPVYTLPMLTLILTVFNLLVGPLQNAVSRTFERQADRYALQSTKLPDAFRSAFLKLSKQNKADPDPHPVEVFLLHSHPPIGQRIGLSEEWGVKSGE